MFPKRAFLSVFILLVLAAMPVYAGGGSIISFTGDCDSATLTYTSTYNPTGITFTNVDTGATLVPTFSTVPTGTFTATFSPPLAHGTTIQATLNFIGSIQTTVSCPPSPTIATAVVEPYVELCGDGRANINLCEPLAIYPIETDDGIGMAIWDTRRTGTEGQLLYIAAEEMANLPDSSCLLGASADGFVKVVWLGESMVIFAGPDNENKTFIFYFQSFPSVPATDTLFGVVELNLPAC